MSATRVAIIGDGKMGRSVAQVAEANGWTIVAHLGMVDNPGGRGITRTSLAGASVAIEFTEPRSVVANIDACLAAQCPVVVGDHGVVRPPAGRDGACRARGRVALLGRQLLPRCEHHDGAGPRSGAARARVAAL